MDDVPAYSDEIKRMAIRMYTESEMPLAKIAKLPGMPAEPTLRRWLRAAKVDMRPRYRHRYPRKEIAKMLRAGVPRSEIRKQFGCSEKYLSQLATKKIKVCDR